MLEELEPKTKELPEEKNLEEDFEEEPEEKRPALKIISALLLLLLLAVLFYFGFITIKRLLYPASKTVLTANAGPDRKVWKNQSVVLKGSVSGTGKKDILVYNWTCSGGTLSSNLVLTPTFQAPDVSKDEVISCAFDIQVKNKRGKTKNSSEDEMKITVKNSSLPVTLSANVKEIIVSKPIDLSVLTSGNPGEKSIYSLWCDCSYDSTDVNVAKSQCGDETIKKEVIESFSYTAERLCQYKSIGNYTSKVIVENGKDLGESRYVVSVLEAPNNPPVISAYPDMTVLSGSSQRFKASAKDPENNPLAYEWSCSDGKLSDYKVLLPVFTAPEVTSDKEITCYLSVSDGRNVVHDTKMIFVKTSIDGTGRQLPVANAGPDKIANAKELVILDGSLSYDPRGKKLTYDWFCTGGDLTSPSAVKPILLTPAVPYDTNILCTLTVSNGLDIAKDTVNIKIKTAESNNPPIADAGIDQTAGSRVQVNLNGSQSFDIDKDPLTYNWFCDKGQLAGQNTAWPVLTTPEIETDTRITCTLTVTDSKGASDSDVTMVTVIKLAGQNHAPIADAGPNITMSESSQTTLDGSGSSDPDEDPLTYKWACTGGALSSDTNKFAQYTSPSVEYDTTFRCTLTVVDDKGAFASDTAIIIVKNTTINHPPVAVINEGDTNVIPGRVWILNGSMSSDPDNDPLTYKWSCEDGCFLNQRQTICDLNQFNASVSAGWRAPDIGCQSNQNASKNVMCTLTVTDTGGLTASDYISFLVRCPPPLCPNGACDSGETALSCPQDCPARCGDKMCSQGETLDNCPQDCARCGDGICTSPYEFVYSYPVAYSNCPQDCYCGNLTCDLGENKNTCLYDCANPPVARAAADPSTVYENQSSSLSADGSYDPEGGSLRYTWWCSPGTPTAGGYCNSAVLDFSGSKIAQFKANIAGSSVCVCNYSCAVNVTSNLSERTGTTSVNISVKNVDPACENVAYDCMRDTMTCQSSGIYGQFSTLAACQAACVSWCGDGICSQGEDSSSCWPDCGSSSCGNSVCEPGEDISCPSDCSVGGGGCGDGLCSFGENYTTCPTDCQSFCGDGICDEERGEGYYSCRQDCPNPSPTPDTTP